MSGKKLYINPKDVIIPSDRQRKLFTQEELDNLAMSIKRFGQLQPSILTKNLEIIAGERRTKAVTMIMEEEEKKGVPKDLRIKGLWYVIDDNDSIIVRKEIELEENLRRADLTWLEKVDAVAELHILKCRAYANWRQVDTANSLNISRALVSTYCLMHKAFSDYPQLRGLTSLMDALNVYKDIKAQEVNAEMAKRKKKEYENVKPIQAKPSHATPEPVKNISFIPHLHHINCIDFMHKLPSNSVDIIITDPMWGVNINENIEYSAPSDEKVKCLSVLDKFMEQASRVMKPDTNMLMFFGNENYEWIRNCAKAHNLIPYPVPLLWIKNNGYSPTMDFYPGHAYEPIMRIMKGKPPLHKRRTLDYFPVTAEPNKVHPFEKPVKLWMDILDTFAGPGSVMLDGFGGSCTSAVAGYKLDMFPLVCELDEHYYNVGIQTWEREINHMGCQTDE